MKKRTFGRFTEVTEQKNKSAKKAAERALGNNRGQSPDLGEGQSPDLGEGFAGLRGGESQFRVGGVGPCCREGNGTPLRTLAWKIPWTEEPGRLPSMGSHRVRHD